MERLGYLKDGICECKSFKESVSPKLLDNEIIIKPELCVREASSKLKKEEIVYTPEPQVSEKDTEVKEEETAFEEDIKEYTRINLKLNVPKGQMSNIVKVVNYLNSLFNECKVKVEITAKNGKIKATDFENRIEEALRQAGIEVEEENKYGG